MSLLIADRLAWTSITVRSEESKMLPRGKLIDNRICLKTILSINPRSQATRKNDGERDPT